VSKIYVDEILPKDNSTVDGSKLSALPTSGMPTGSVLQVVQSVAPSGSELTNTSTSWADTGFSVTITPKSSTSHFLVRMSLNAYMGYGHSGGVGIWRNGSVMVDKVYGFCFLWITNERGSHNLSKEFLDTTSSSQSITYSVYTRCGSTSETINCPHSPTDILNTITVTEIAG